MRLKVTCIFLLINASVLAQFEGAGLYKCLSEKRIWSEPKTYVGNRSYQHLKEGETVQLSSTIVFEEYDGEEIIWCRLHADHRWITENYIRQLDVNSNDETIDCDQPPPVLELITGSVELSDANGNGFVDANEKCEIRFSLENTGPGLSQFADAQAIGANRTSHGVWVEGEGAPLSIAAGGIGEIAIALSSDRHTFDGEVTLEIEVTDRCGFGILPFDVTLPTRSFLEPEIRVVDATSSPANWTRGKPIALTILVQNTGRGAAKEVLVALDLPSGVVCFSNNEITEVSSLNSGDTRELTFDILIPKTFESSSVKTNISITEQYELYGNDWSRLDEIGDKPTKASFSIGSSSANNHSRLEANKIGRLSNYGFVEFNTNPKDVVVDRVAVVAAKGMDCGGVLRPGQDLASYVEGSLLGYYEVVERRNLERVLDEQKLALSGIMFEKSTVEAGCNIGAQGIIFTEFGCIGGEETIQVKLVDCQTSELYWSATGHGSSILDVVKEIKANLDE